MTSTDRHHTLLSPSFAEQMNKVHICHLADAFAQFLFKLFLQLVSMLYIVKKLLLLIKQCCSLWLIDRDGTDFLLARSYNAIFFFVKF